VQVFAEISDSSQFTIICSEDGILGMGFDDLASSQQVGSSFTVSFLYLSICLSLSLSPKNKNTRNKVKVK